MLVARPITTKRVFNMKKVAPGQTIESKAIPLSEIAQNGYFSAEYLISGDGTMNLTYKMSSKESGPFFVPESASIANVGIVKNGLTKTSGVNGSGGISFKCPLFPFIKFYAVETGGVFPVQADIRINVQ
jgi:hypothetical protein